MTSDPWKLDPEDALRRDSVWIWMIQGGRWIVDARTPDPELVVNHSCYPTQKEAFHGLRARFERMRIEIDGQIQTVDLALKQATA